MATCFLVGFVRSNHFILLVAFILTVSVGSFLAVLSAIFS